MEEQLYAKRFVVVENCIISWDESQGLGEVVEREVYRKEYGPFQEEEAQREKLRLRDETEQLISSDRPKARERFNLTDRILTGTTMGYWGRITLGPGDFNVFYELEERMIPVNQ
ncbi:MAG: hypothetical protein Q8P81_04220 [Nanoarchaeota archaeon]|nr:hypothetical protein [Nanoarchaeota archaeon]